MKPGDCFYTLWGYDQTNYDFVVVDALSPSGKTALCRMAKLAENVPDGQCWKQVPSPEGYGDPFRLRVEHRDDGETWLRGSYPFVEGSRRLDTFWPHKDGDAHYETDTQFGH